MADFPALPLWTDAYLADTRTLSTLQHGAYLLLLMEAWRRPDCSLPSSDATLAKLAGLSRDEWDEIKGDVMAFFHVDEKRGVIRQKRLTKERAFLDEKRTKNRASAARRWKEREKANANAMQTQCQNDAPTPTPTPTTLKENKAPSDPSKRGTRLPADFQPDIGEAMRLGLPEQRAKSEAAKFVDYWRSKSGAGATKKDWPATWRVWVRTALDRMGGGGRAPPEENDYWRRQREMTEEAERRAGYGKRSDGENQQPTFDLGPRDYEAGK